MDRFRINKIYLLILFLFVSASLLKAQITAVGYDKFTKISKEDTAYIFCTTKDNASVGELTAKSPMGVSSTFSWEKYDTISGTFNPFNGKISEDTLSSTISRLDDGLYRVNIKSGGNIIPPYQAYVLNNWIEITKAEIPDSSSTCEGFMALGGYKAAPLRYFDPITNNIKSLRNPNTSFTINWYKGSDATPIRLGLNTYISPPEASEPPIVFKLVIKDWFDCISPANQGSVEYYSKVPKSLFTFDPAEGEAVLKVTFKNNSINYDSSLWHFYKDDVVIKREAEDKKNKVIDSIAFVLTENQPVYEYEWAGQYKVNLVTVHVNKTGNCYDTLYMKPGDFIQVDTALVEAPNVFTPNGDGQNDEYVVKTKSLKGMKIKIYNRWGGLVHSWSYSNIRSRNYTYEHSVWDGKIGGRMASPGVYFYVINVVRRDDKPTKPKTGFFHLFRTKD